MPAHRTRTKLEAAVCAEMERQGVLHAHRVLRYRVRMQSGRTTPFEPAIVVHRGPILFLVEPSPSYRRGQAQRHARFLAQHSEELVLLLVAPATVAARFSKESYDELYEDSKIAKLVARIREQDPRGTLRPFDKTRGAREGS